MKRYISWPILGAVMSIAMLPLANAQATVIVVDNACTLADAITAANTDTAVGDCQKGSGKDTITLTDHVTLSAALPEITSVITIKGEGYRISGNNDATVGSVLVIASTGHLTLKNTKVVGGKLANSANYGAGIRNAGTLMLSNSIVKNNTAIAFYDPDDAHFYAYGAGIYNIGTTILINSQVNNNAARSTAGALRAFGGGIYNAGTLMLAHSTVSGNAATSSRDMSPSRGGGLYNSGTATLINSKVNTNTATAISRSFGGGLYSSGTITLINTTVNGNATGSSGDASPSSGGGLYNDLGIATLINSTISNNTTTALADSVTGGGVCSTGPITITRTTISGNSANSPGFAAFGGGVYSNSSAITVKNSTISGNSVVASLRVSGGGIYSSGTGAVTLTNSTVSGNTATSSDSSAYGGGIFSTDTVAVTLTHTTVSGNTVSSSDASASGGGIYNSSTGEFMLKNSLVSGNTAADSGAELYSKSTVTADSYNVFGHSGETSKQALFGCTPGSSDVSATSDDGSPQALTKILKALANNGGPTKTHALLAGSPAVNLDADCTAGLSKDQRGMPRPIGNGCDAGAFELGRYYR